MQPYAGLIVNLFQLENSLFRTETFDSPQTSSV